MGSSVTDEIEVTHDLPDIPKDKYRPDEIEQPLKMSIEPRKIFSDEEYITIDQIRRMVKLRVSWETFTRWHSSTNSRIC